MSNFLKFTIQESFIFSIFFKSLKKVNSQKLWKKRKITKIEINKKYIFFNFCYFTKLQKTGFLKKCKFAIFKNFQIIKKLIISFLAQVY